MKQDADIALKREFLAEAHEILAELDGCAAALLAGDREALGRHRRSARILSGAAQVVGFDAFAATAQPVATVFARVLDGQLQASATLAAAAAATVALLKGHALDLAEDFDAALDAGAALAALHAAGGGGDAHPEALTNWTKAPTLSEGAAPIILVCDDDPDVLDTFGAIFAMTSYQVRLMPTPAAALAYVEEHKIDVLITDLIMPGMNGLQLIAKVLELDPQVPVLLCSGFAERADLLTAIRLGASDVFEKPFTPQKVLASVKEALDRRRAVEAMMQLAGANFRAFVLGSRLLEHMPSGMRARYEDCLEEIGRLTHALLGKGAA